MQIIKTTWFVISISKRMHLSYLVRAARMRCNRMIQRIFALVPIQCKCSCLLEMENFATSSFTLLNDSAGKVARIQRTMNAVIHNLQLHPGRSTLSTAPIWAVWMVGISDTVCVKRRQWATTGTRERTNRRNFRQDTVFATYIFFTLLILMCFLKR